jgi:hypothetical protein
MHKWDRRLGDCRFCLEHHSATGDWWPNRTGAMPRFFFHYRDGDKAAEDTEGIELANEAESVLEAMISAKEIIAEALFRGEAVPREAEFSVTDSEHRQLYVFPFTLAADQPTGRFRKRRGSYR